MSESVFTKEVIQAKMEIVFESMRKDFPSMTVGDLQTIAMFMERLKKELKPKNIYQENGYQSRKEYLDCLADEYAVPRQIVYTMATTLGPSEDFDGLVSGLQDIEGEYDEDDIIEDY